jgi:hypothetical protein
MPSRFQFVIDCADPDRLARFWMAALGYQPQPPPGGYASWDDYYRYLGVPEDELDIGVDHISDPGGHGPSIWFQVVPEAKTIKNRLHLDVNASGGWTVPMDVRRERVDAEVQRLAGLGATIREVPGEDAVDFYGVGMLDPEGNEFDIN